VEIIPVNSVGPWQSETDLAPPPGRLGSLGAARRFRISEAVYLRNEPIEFWYQMVCGSGRRFAMSYDGRCQIVEFLLPGDLFGFGDGASKHLFSVEAIASGTTVVAYPRRCLERLVDSDPRLGRRVRELVLASISRIQARVVTLGRTSALARVSAFLLEMAERFRAGPANAIILPMSRYDIADYLCIAVETVSRALTELRQRGVIRFGDIRSVQICDRSALEALSEGSQPDEPRVLASTRTSLERRAKKPRVRDGRNGGIVRLSREVLPQLLAAEASRDADRVSAAVGEGAGVVAQLHLRLETLRAQTSEPTTAGRTAETRLPSAANAGA
jgi:CRP-like cAMP-binding protein